MAIKTVSDPRDWCDELSGRLAQLQAQMVLICGEGLESFQSMNDNLQANYLWGVQRGIEECKELAEQVHGAILKATKHGGFKSEVQHPEFQ